MGDDRAAASRHRSGPRSPIALPGPLGRLLPTAAAAASLLLPVAALAAVQAASPASQRVPTGAARFELAGSWLAAAPGALDGAASWTAVPLLGRLQLGALIRLLEAGPAQSALGAAQLVLVLLAVLQAALLWWLLRRTGRSAIAAGLAVAAFAVAPAAVAAHATASTAAVAAVWLLAAGLLATAPGRVAAPAAGAAAVLAIASHPLAAIPVAVAAAALLRAARGGAARPAAAHPRLPAALVSAGVLAVALVALALVGAARAPSSAARSLDAVAAAQGGPSFGGAAPLAWASADPLGALVAVVALVAASRHGRTRVLGVIAALLLIGSVWPAGADAAGPLVLLLPVAAAATASTVDRAVIALGHPDLRRSLVGSGWLTGVAALLLVAVVVSLSGLTALVPASARPVARAERWLRGSVPADQVVLVGLGAWPDLQAASRARVAWYAVRGAGSPASSAPWSDADYVVADAALAADASGAARDALSRSVLVARFGSGADGLAVRAVRGGGAASAPAGTPSTGPAPTAEPSPSTTTTPSTGAELRAAAARVRAGRQLSGNARIELDGADRALLTSGMVDTRIALVLAQFSTAHRLTVGGFGTARGDTTGIRTTVLISEVDGRRVPADVQRTGDLLRFLSALRGDFATRSIDSAEDGVTAGFTPDTAFVPSS